jgi:hypothetical protein
MTESLIYGTEMACPILLRLLLSRKTIEMPTQELRDFPQNVTHIVCNPLSEEQRLWEVVYSMMQCSQKMHLLYRT